MKESKAVGTVLGWGGGGGGGGGKQNFTQKDTILFISISVISKIHWAISLFDLYLYQLFICHYI